MMLRSPIELEIEMARRRNRGSSRVLGDVNRGTDWVVAGGAIASDGVLYALSGWNPAPAQTAALPNSGVLTASQSIAFQAVSVPLLAASPGAAPVVGRVRVSAIQGSVYFNAPSAAGLYVIGVGIVMAKQNGQTGKWDQRFPSNPDQAQADDWLYLKTMTMYIPTTTTPGITSPMVLEFVLGLTAPIQIGGGEALHVVADAFTVPSGGGINVNPAFRTSYRNIS